MLKIKDNVDLKELEKYGFKPHYELKDNRTGESVITHYYQTRSYDRKYGTCHLFPIKKRKSCIINIPSRKIENHLEYNSLKIDDRDFIDLDILYDLIKADLVEKFEDNGE